MSVSENSLFYVVSCSVLLYSKKLAQTSAHISHMLLLWRTEWSLTRFGWFLTGNFTILRRQQRKYVHPSSVAQYHRGSVSDSVYQLQRAFLRHTLFSVCTQPYRLCSLALQSKRARSLRFTFPLLITTVSHSSISKNSLYKKFYCQMQSVIAFFLKCVC